MVNNQYFANSAWTIANNVTTSQAVIYVKPGITSSQSHVFLVQGTMSHSAIYPLQRHHSEFSA
jgi:hypothetical protein